MELAGDDLFRMRLIGWLSRGLPVSATPYEDIARNLGCNEVDVLNAIQELREQNIIKRDGIIVRHGKVGYHANAMCVWDIPDASVADIGRKMAAFEFVTLCYRRPRKLPKWPYNLFCMVHGKSRDKTLGFVEELVQALELEDTPRDILFSTRGFKQLGANYGISPTGTGVA